jgi:hypothetical protein
METYRKKQTERQKKVYYVSGGFVIPAAQNNSLNDST